MPKPKESKTTIVREHTRKLYSKNQDPIKITIVDQHPRNLPGRSLAKDEMFLIFETYTKAGIIYPNSALPIDPDAI